MNRRKLLLGVITVPLGASRLSAEHQATQLSAGPIMSHRGYETFIGHDNPELTEAVQKLLEDHYREDQSVEVFVSLNGCNKTLIQVRSVRRYDTGWRRLSD